MFIDFRSSGTNIKDCNQFAVYKLHILRLRRNCFRSRKKKKKKKIPLFDSLKHGASDVLCLRQAIFETILRSRPCTFDRFSGQKFRWMKLNLNEKVRRVFRPENGIHTRRYSSSGRSR